MSVKSTAKVTGDTQRHVHTAQKHSS